MDKLQSGSYVGSQPQDSRGGDMTGFKHEPLPKAKSASHKNNKNESPFIGFPAFCDYIRTVRSLRFSLLSNHGALLT